MATIQKPLAGMSLDDAHASSSEAGGPDSLIASSENPLHSPSASETEHDDDLLGEEDDLSSYYGSRVGSGGDLFLGDSLYMKNPLETPTGSPQSSIDLADGTKTTESRMADLELALKENQAQEARRTELEGWMTEIKEKTDEDGEPSVLMPQDFSLLVQNVLQEIKPAEGEKDWLTKAREDALAVADANASAKPSWMQVKAEDPKTQEALGQAIELDKKLREKQIEAKIIWRETFPEQWEEQRQKKNEQMRAQAKRAIQDERKRRARLARLNRALQKMDGNDKDDHMGRNAALGPDARYFKLMPEEEELVEKLLAEESDAEDKGAGTSATENPFELQIMPFGGEDSGLDLARDTVKHLAEIDTKLSGLAEDHLFDETGSMISFRSSHAGHSRKQESEAEGHRPRTASTMLTDLQSQSLGKEESVAGTEMPAPPLSVAGSSRSRATHTTQNGAGRGSVMSEKTKAAQDYLREQRLRREEAEREKELDRRLRELRTSELPGPRDVPPAELNALLAECKRAHESGEARMYAINRMHADMESAEPRPRCSSASPSVASSQAIPTSASQQGSSGGQAGTSFSGQTGLQSRGVEGLEEEMLGSSFITQAAMPALASPSPSRPHSAGRPRSSIGPSRPASQRRPNDSSTLPVAPDSQASTSRRPPTPTGARVILHNSGRSRPTSSSDVDRTDALALPLPRTPKSGRRSRGASDCGAEESFGSKSPAAAAVAAPVDLLAGLGEDRAMQRVPSAGRRAASPFQQKT